MGVAIGMDKHPAGAFSADSVEYALPAWYGETGHFMTTKFFGMKINRYMHDHGISESTLAKVAAKAFRHGEKNPNAFRRQPLTEEQILESPMLNNPRRQFMFCPPAECAAAVVVCRVPVTPRHTHHSIYQHSHSGVHRKRGTKWY